MVLSADNARLVTYRAAPKEFSVAKAHTGWAVEPMKPVIRVWDTMTGKEVCTYNGHEFGICSLAISPQGRTVASSDWDGNIHIWEIPERSSELILSHSESESMLPKSERDNGKSPTLPEAQNDANTSASAEKAAAGRLGVAKQFAADGGKSTARKVLEDLISRYPMTRAAEEARRLLMDLKK